MRSTWGRGSDAVTRLLVSALVSPLLGVRIALDTNHYVDFARGVPEALARVQRAESGPHVVILAGPNGAGKSTTASELLRGALRVAEFVNADVIARGLSAFDLDSVTTYRQAVDTWRLYDNSRTGGPELIAASGRINGTTVVQREPWERMRREYRG